MSGEGREGGEGAGGGRSLEGFTLSMDALWKQAPSGTTSYSAS